MPETPPKDQLELWNSSPEAQENVEPFTAGMQLDLGGVDQNPRPSITPQQTVKQLDTSFALRRPLDILVADDNEINRKVIRVILQKLGYNCVEATNGQEALASYNSGDYDYIFMDLDMPEMTGIEAAQAIRDLEKETTGGEAARTAEIIAVTANVSDETRLKCRRAGMNGYLEKPITASTIKDQLLRSWPRIRSRRGK